MKKSKTLNFTPVAMFFIVLGIVFFILGLFMIFFASNKIIAPGFSYLITIGGALIMIGGYTNLELGLIRKQMRKK